MLIHNKSIKELPPNDYLIIEKEHQLLEKYLNDLRHACVCSNLDKLPYPTTCDKEKQHFDHEETIMLSMI